MVKKFRAKSRSWLTDLRSAFATRSSFFLFASSMEYEVLTFIDLPDFIDSYRNVNKILPIFTEILFELCKRIGKCYRQHGEIHENQNVCQP